MFDCTGSAANTSWKAALCDVTKGTSQPRNQLLVYESPEQFGPQNKSMRICTTEFFSLGSFCQMEFSPLALEGAELVTLGEAEWLELRLEVDGLGCGRGRQKAEISSLGEAVAWKRPHRQRRRQQLRQNLICFWPADTPLFFN